MTRGVRKDTGRSANWKGGKTVTSHGYVLVWVGKDHPLADVRGYAYEHRLVAAAQEGRVLDSKEQVHHKDEDPQNNDPTNLEVKGSFAEHRRAHRRAGSNLQRADEPNVVIPCACGCGAKLLKFDSTGRSRSYVSGHNPHSSPTTDAIRAALKTGPKTRAALVTETGVGVQALATALSKLKRMGVVVNVSHGCWELVRAET